MLEQQLLEEFAAGLRAEVDDKLGELEPDAMLAADTALSEVMLAYMEEAGLATEHDLCPYEDTTTQHARTRSK